MHSWKAAQQFNKTLFANLASRSSYLVVGIEHSTDAELQTLKEGLEREALATATQGAEKEILKKRNND